jgi:hypothetical protein
MYMGAAVTPMFNMKPFKSHVAIFPRAQKACGVSEGGAKGPTVKLMDWWISDTHNP